MDKKYTNPCFRCGKERVFLKAWEEVVTTFSGTKVKVQHEESVCPDPECQKLLNKDFAAQKVKRDEIAQNKAQRAIDNQAKKGGLRVVKEGKK